jgi:ElaB/YqjD/DUF883 family membrane-anchored ribosome-binding protein
MDSNRDNQGSTGSDFRNYGSGTEGSSQFDGGNQFDDGTRAGSFDRKFTGEDSDGLETGSTGGVKGAIGDRVETGKQKLGGAVDAGKNRVAGQIERISDLVEERARSMEEAGGVQRRASQAALRATEALDTSAEYIRSRNPDEMRDDLERQIRARPLLSIGIAAAAGFLLARSLRD